MKDLQHCLSWVEEDKKVISPASRVPYYPLVVDHAKGCTVVDADGNEYLDFLASAAALNTGHCHPKVVAAIKQQADK
ncbi:MAG: aminotransferase class III-fold pyridoxal phosphate-dependent enzyme, partial [Firmicutes bacterium]|nr:aminotransferase class III-fold pyridoxal phosphate-dependent enzyme [Bacillota bacterium]